MTHLDWAIEDATMRMRSALGDSQMLWARRVVTAKGARGDYPLVVQPMSSATIEALARQEIIEMEKVKT